MIDTCIFCRIIAGQVPADVIAETERLSVFLSLENHPLVVPRTHVENIYALDDLLAADVMRTAVRIARAVKSSLGCDGVLLAQANERAGGQTVFHLHVHVMPRWHGDPVIRQTQPVPDPAVRRERRDRIVAALEPLDIETSNTPRL